MFALLGILLGTGIGLFMAIEVDWGDIGGLEMAGFTSCAATVALGVWSLLLDYDEEPRVWMIAPSVLADSGGGAVPAALLGGTF